MGVVVDDAHVDRTVNHDLPVDQKPPAIEGTYTAAQLAELRFGEGGSPSITRPRGLDRSHPTADVHEPVDLTLPDLDYSPSRGSEYVKLDRIQTTLDQHPDAVGRLIGIKFGEPPVLLQESEGYESLFKVLREELDIVDRFNLTVLAEWGDPATSHLTIQQEGSCRRFASMGLTSEGKVFSLREDVESLWRRLRPFIKSPQLLENAGSIPVDEDILARVAQFPGADRIVAMGRSVETWRDKGVHEVSFVHGPTGTEVGRVAVDSSTCQVVAETFLTPDQTSSFDQLLGSTEAQLATVVYDFDLTHDRFFADPEKTKPSRSAWRNGTLQRAAERIKDILNIPSEMNVRLDVSRAGSRYTEPILFALWEQEISVNLVPGGYVSSNPDMLKSRSSRRDFVAQNPANWTAKALFAGYMEYLEAGRLKERHAKFDQLKEDVRRTFQIPPTQKFDLKFEGEEYIESHVRSNNGHRGSSHDTLRMTVDFNSPRLASFYLFFSEKDDMDVECIGDIRLYRSDSQDK